jgi:hypothetical protein
VSNGQRVGAGSIAEAHGELGARSKAELAVDVAEVEFDGLGAQEERSRHLLVRCPSRDGKRDLKLLGSQLLQLSTGLREQPFAGGSELGASAIAPWGGSKVIKHDEGAVEAVSSLARATRTSETLAEAQLSARALERVVHCGVQLECGVKVAFEVTLRGK